MTGTVVLGLGGCVDHELRLSAPVLASLIREYRIRDAELTSQAVITDERDLVVSILAYLKKGAGGEHFVGSGTALGTFAHRFPVRTTLGGTPIRAAKEMSKLGVPSTLHLVSINDVMRELLPADCAYVCSDDKDTVNPNVIVQYAQGFTVREGDIDIRAPFPNRLIYVNDPANGSMVLSPELGSLLRGASLFLVSGFNAIRDRNVLARRLESLRNHMRNLPAEAVVYYEDAGFHEPAFSRYVREALLDHIDIYGLNEDEMQAYLGHVVDLMSVDEVAAALRALRDFIPGPTVVLHTKYWSLAMGENAGASEGALNEGMVVASTRYAHGDESTDKDHQRMRDRPRWAGAEEFAAALERRMGGDVCCVPGFRLDVAEPTTVGLGDAFVGGFLAALAKAMTE